MYFNKNDESSKCFKFKQIRRCYSNFYTLFRKISLISYIKYRDTYEVLRFRLNRRNPLLGS